MLLFLYNDCPVTATHTHTHKICITKPCLGYFKMYVIAITHCIVQFLVK